MHAPAHESMVAMAALRDCGFELVDHSPYRQLRARRALLQLKDVPLRTRRALLLYKINGNNALLALS